MMPRPIPSVRRSRPLVRGLSMVAALVGVAAGVAVLSGCRRQPWRFDSADLSRPSEARVVAGRFWDADDPIRRARRGWPVRLRAGGSMVIAEFGVEFVAERDLTANDNRRKRRLPRGVEPDSIPGGFGPEQVAYDPALRERIVERLREVFVVEAESRGFTVVGAEGFRAHPDFALVPTITPEQAGVFGLPRPIPTDSGELYATVFATHDNLPMIKRPEDRKNRDILRDILRAQGDDAVVMVRLRVGVNRMGVSIERGSRAWFACPRRYLVVDLERTLVSEPMPGAGDVLSMPYIPSEAAFVERLEEVAVPTCGMMFRQAVRVIGRDPQTDDAPGLSPDGAGGPADAGAADDAGTDPAGAADAS